MPHLLDEKEAAEFLGVNADKLNDLTTRKLIPAYMVAGKFLRFKKHELEAIRRILRENADAKDERIFSQAFSEVRGIERFKEVLRSNDVYLAVVGAIILLSIVIFFK